MPQNYHGAYPNPCYDLGSTSWKKNVFFRAWPKLPPPDFPISSNLVVFFLDVKTTKRNDDDDDKNDKIIIILWVLSKGLLLGQKGPKRSGRGLPQYPPFLPPIRAMLERKHSLFGRCSPTSSKGAADLQDRQNPPALAAAPRFSLHPFSIASPLEEMWRIILKHCQRHNGPRALSL